jgi:MFS family permease
MKSGLFNSRNFLGLWLLSVVSTTSFSIASITEALYAIKVLHMESQFGLVLICGSLPRIFFMMIGGVLADNLEKVHVVFLSFAARAALMLGMAALIFAGHFTFPMVLGLALLYGLMDAIYLPVREAFLYQIIDDQYVSQGISTLITTGQICSVISPAIAGVLLMRFDYSAIFSALGVLLVIAGGLTYTFERGKASIGSGARLLLGGGGLRYLVSELKDGLSYIRHHPQFSVLMPLFAIANMLSIGPLQQSVPLLASGELAGNSAAYGTLWSCFAAGSAAGGIWISTRRQINRKFVFIVYMLLAESLLLAGLALATNVIVGVSVMFLIGFCISLNNLPVNYMLQTYADKDRIGRLLSVHDTLTVGLAPISYLLVLGLLMLGVHYKVILVFAGVSMFLFCLTMMKRFPIIRTTD